MVHVLLIPRRYFYFSIWTPKCDKNLCQGIRNTAATSLWWNEGIVINPGSGRTGIVNLVKKYMDMYNFIYTTLINFATKIAHIFQNYLWFPNRCDLTSLFFTKCMLLIAGFQSNCNYFENRAHERTIRYNQVEASMTVNVTYLSKNPPHTHLL